MPDASTATNSDTATPELMKAISAAFNSRDVDRIVSFFTDDATFWLARGPEPVGRTLAGKETIRKALADRFKVIPDMRWDHQEYIYAGNRAISVWTVRGKGADGEDLNYQGCDIYTFRGGKICAKNTFWKMVEHKDRLLILARLTALVTLALLAGPSRAAETVGVEILQYGLFRSDIVGKQADAGGISHNVVDNICHIATTRDVPMKIGVHFGVRYKVTGPVAAERVLLRKVIQYPAVLVPPGGRPASMVSNFVELKVGTTTYTEYALEQPWELAPGTWTFQFFERDRKLAEFSFTVTEGASVSETANPTCFQLSS